MKRSSRIAGFDGVRAIAAASVLVYHVWLYSFISGAALSSEAGGGVPFGPLNKVFDNLRSGVTLFFVLSGFLLFRPFAAALVRGTRWPSTRSYLRNRALRILPAYWAILLAVGLLFQRGMFTDPLKGLTNATFVRTYVPPFERWNGVAYSGLGIGPAWTLMIEVVFYLLLPLLAVWGARLVTRHGVSGGLAVWLPVAALVAVGVVGQVVDEAFTTGRPFRESFLPYAGFFAPGMALAVLHVYWEDERLRLFARWRVAVVVTGLGLGAVALKLFYAGAIDYSAAQWIIAVACAFVLALVAFAEPGSRVVSVLEWRPLALLGLVSYSVYLWHDPIVHGFRDHHLTFAGRGGFLVNLVAIGAVTIVASALTYRLVERPALARKRSMTKTAEPMHDGGATASKLSTPPWRLRSRVSVPEWFPQRDPRLRSRRIDVRARIQGLVSGIAPSLRARVAVTGDEPVHAVADPEAFDRIVSAILDNALEYSTTPVRIALHKDDGCIQLAVEDDGRGVDPAFVPHLFEPYARSEPSRRARPGAGLGLAVAKVYAKAMGGTLDYDTEAAGARFVLQLPLAPSVGGSRLRVATSRGLRGLTLGGRRGQARVACQRRVVPGDWRAPGARRLGLSAVGLTALLAVLVLAGGAAAAPTLPTSMAALGDSLTRAYGAGGSAADAPKSSWSTGANASVNSHYTRLLSLGAAISGNAFNDAQSGTKMAATYAQAGSAVTQGAGYVTILAGTNDACTSTVAGMTSVAAFTSQFQSTLTRLSTGLPSGRIFVASIPDWYGLWQRLHTNSAAVAEWSSTAVCPDLLSTSATDSDRLAVAQRISDFNAALSSTCATFANCVYDGGAVFRLAPATSDLAFDYFHYSVSGQAMVAAATWAVSPYAGGGGGGSSGTFGKTSVGSVWGAPGQNIKDVNRFVLGVSGSVQKLTMYVDGGGVSSSGSQPVEGVIYADGGGLPGALVAVSSPVSVVRGQAAGWVDFPFASSVSLAAGSYWIGFFTGGGATVVRVSLDESAPNGTERYNSDAFADGPSNPFGSTLSSTSALSVYATYGGGSPPPAAPSNTALPVISGSAVQGQQLSTTNGSWSGAPTSYAYQWQRCGGSCVDVGGAVSSTYTLVAADVGSTMRVRVTASNAGGSTAAMSVATAVVTASGGGGSSGTFGKTSVGSVWGAPGQNIKDVNRFVLGVSGSVQKLTMYVDGGGVSSSGSQPVEGVIYADGGGLPGALVAVSSPVSVVRGQAAGWVDFPFASSVSLAAGSYWIGFFTGGGATVVRVSLDESAPNGTERYNSDAFADGPSNPFGSTLSSTSALSVYATYGGGSPPPAAPSNTALPVISGSAVQGQQLSTTNGSWSGAPTSYAYQWQRCGGSCVDVGGAVSSTYTLVAADVGSTMRVRVTASNAGGSTAAMSVATAVVTASGGGGSSGTFGKTSVGSVWGAPGQNIKDVNRFVLGVSGSVQKLTMYVDGGGVSSSGSQPVEGVIYADGGGLPGVLVAVSSPVSVVRGQAAGWVDFPFASSVSLAAGSYWIGFFTGGGATVVRVSLDESAPNGTERYNSDAFADGPSNPFGSTLSSTSALSVYATYS